MRKGGTPATHGLPADCEVNIILFQFDSFCGTTNHLKFTLDYQ